MAAWSAASITNDATPPAVWSMLTLALTAAGTMAPRVWRLGGFLIAGCEMLQSVRNKTESPRCPKRTVHWQPAQPSWWSWCWLAASLAAFFAAIRTVCDAAPDTTVFSSSLYVSYLRRGGSG